MDNSRNYDLPRRFDIYVGNLPPDVDSNVLRRTFLPFGEVFGVRVMYDQITRKSKGYGFVSYSTREQAQSAIYHTNGTFLGRKKIDTYWASKKEDKYNEQINTLNQTITAKNREIEKLKEELKTQKDDFNAIQKKYSQVYADASRFHQERAKLRNDLKEKTLSFENLEREFNSQKTENFNLQLEIHKLKLEQSLNGSTQTRPNNSTVTSDAPTQNQLHSSNGGQASNASSDVPTQNQLHSSNGGQASNASSANQQRQKRPFPMPKKVKTEELEEIYRKAETRSNQPLTKPLQNENQSSVTVMNQASASNASSNVNGQEEKKLVTDIPTILSGSNPSLVQYVNGSVPSVAANSSKRKNDGASKDNAQSSKRSKL